MLRNMEPFFAGNYPYALKSRPRNHVLRLQARSFLRRSDAVIAVSKYVADYARSTLAINPEVSDQCCTRLLTSSRLLPTSNSS